MKSIKRIQALQQFFWGIGMGSLLLNNLVVIPSAWALSNDRNANGTYVSDKGGAKRACGDPMIAMVPNEIKAGIGGYTTLASPEFWVDIPYEPGEVIRGKLVFSVVDAQNKKLYEKEVAAPTKPGLSRFKLPEGRSLQAGQRYSWSLTANVQCKQVNGDGTKPVVKQEAFAWVERYDPDTQLSARLSKATPFEKAQIFAGSENTWYDAFSLLSTLYQSDLENPQVQELWNKTLEKYGRSSFSQRPFVSSELIRRRPGYYPTPRPQSSPR